MMAWNGELKMPDSPLEFLVNARSECWRALRLILGFDFDLRPASQRIRAETAIGSSNTVSDLFGKDYRGTLDSRLPAKPPEVIFWLGKRMAERADTIAREVEVWQGMEEKMKQSLEYIQEHPYFEEMARLALARSSQILESTEPNSIQRGPCLRLSDYQVYHTIKDLPHWGHNPEKKSSGGICLHLDARLVSNRSEIRVVHLSVSHHVPNIVLPSARRTNTKISCFEWQM